MADTNQQNTLVVIIFSIIAVISWVGFELARSYYTTTTPEVVEEQIRALNPKIDTNTLQSLSSRLTIPEEELQKTLASSVVITATKSAQPTATGSTQQR